MAGSATRVEPGDQKLRSPPARYAVQLSPYGPFHELLSTHLP